MSEKGKNIDKIKKYSSLVLNILTVITALSFIVQTLRIYSIGISPDNQISKGVNSKQIYTPEIIVAHLTEIMPIIILWFICLIICIIIRKIYDFEKENLNVDNLNEWREKAIARANMQVDRGKRGKVPDWITTAVLLIAILLIIVGIFDGGMNDVLKKAIMICAECLGLG